jgi:integrase
MATVVKRTWKSGRRTLTAYGYSLQVECRPCPHKGKTRDVAHPAGPRQERVFNETWSKDDAQKALDARRLELATPKAEAPPPKTFAEVAEEYLATKRAGGKRSLRSDERHLHRYTAEFGAETPITEITAQRVAAYARRRTAETSARLKRAISPSTSNRELSTLRHLLRLAEEWGYIPRAPKVRLWREPRGRVRWLTAPEVDRLLAACQKSRSPHLASIVTVALNTGMRLGEIIGLAWERVSFASGMITLKATKNGDDRYLPMNKAVDAELAGLPGPKVEGPVFARANGTGVKSIRTGFERACVAAKIENFHFYDLRHTYASHLVMAGRPLIEVKELLGHRTLTMTMRYAHLAPGRLRDAVDAVGFSTRTSAHGLAHESVESESVSASS